MKKPFYTTDRFKNILLLVAVLSLIGYVFHDGIPNYDHADDPEMCQPAINC